MCGKFHTPSQWCESGYGLQLLGKVKMEEHDPINKDIENTEEKTNEAVKSLKMKNCEGSDRQPQRMFEPVFECLSRFR